MSDKELFDKAIDSAKNFTDFPDVLMAVSLHPEWLTIIPEERRWAILHQIILSGDVNHLDQLLALQKSNGEFRLLTDTQDGKTVLAIANLRHDVPAMRAHIQRLVKLDEMLNYAKECEWDDCYNLVKEDPTLVNEKPPYRRYYLIHHLTVDNAIAQFERFKQIQGCIFDPTLRADRKKINLIAREADCDEFATFIEKQFPNLLDDTDSAQEDVFQPSEEAIQQTTAITLMIHNSVIKDLDEDLIGKATSKKSRTVVIQQLSEIQSDHEKRREDESSGALKAEDEKHKSLILDNLTCPLTLAVFVDPGRSSEKKYISNHLFSL